VASPNPKLAQRVTELYKVAYRAITEERWADAEMALESAVSMHQRTLTSGSGFDTLTTKWKLQLAYVKQNLNKLPESYEIYKENMTNADVRVVGRGEGFESSQLIGPANNYFSIESNALVCPDGI